MKVAIIGGGWAGMAAAVRLAQRGIRVSVLEAARTLGGRARRVELDGSVLDNGQHILLGAYSRCLSVMREVGIEPHALQRLPLQLHYVQGPGLQAPRWPAPWHMLGAVCGAHGLSLRDKWSMLQFMHLLKQHDWQTPTDMTVEALTYATSANVRRYLLHPLCVSALNTPAEEACAQVFANVLRDSLGAARENSDLLIPQVDLSSLFPDAAARYITARGGEVKLGCAITRIQTSGAHFHLPECTEPFDRVIIATPPTRAREFLGGLQNEHTAIYDTRFEGLRYEPITTVYLKLRRRLVLKTPMLALDSSVRRRDFGQFLFARGEWLAVVISAARQAAMLTHHELVSAVSAQLRATFHLPIEVRAARIITEKRATFLCTPGLLRPDIETPIPGLWLAGDYVASADRLTHYPATLESAVRAGERAAQAIQ